jgi:TonB family protein
MDSTAQMQGWKGPSRRRVPRFRMGAPLDVTVLRSGIPDTVPGRAMNVCERGIGVVLAGELSAGESVGVEFRLSGESEPLRTKATVRYQEELRYGLEFSTISPEQRSLIRDWAKQSGAKPEVTVSSSALGRGNSKEDQGRTGRTVPGGDFARKVQPKRRGAGWLILLLLVAGAAGFFWWKWNRGWEELESGLKNSDSVAVAKPQVQVPAEVMQKLLVHRVEPVYPVEARKQNLQGIIAVDVVVGRDGSVMSMHAVNGPDVLARAAMDALRWWKFEPYRVNGEPAVVETTLAVEFKR